MKVTICKPARAPRRRKSELNKFCVKWKEGDNVYFQWFKRDSQAMRFHMELIESGIDMYDIRVVMK